MSTSVTTATATAAPPALPAALAADAAAPPALPAALSADAAANPLLADWAANAYGLPPFGAVEAAHFAPALAAATAAHAAEAAAIAAAPAAPTFENTVRALDRAGAALDRVARVLSHLTHSATTPALQDAERAAAPALAAHSSRIFFTPGLFARVDAVRAAPAPSPEAARLTERVWLDFVRAGARLAPAAQARAAAIDEALASLCTAFTQNVLADEAEFTLALSAADLAGCPADVVAAARQAALERGGAAAAADADAHVVTLSRSLVEPFLTHAARRDLRERAWRAWSRRGELSAARDNVAIAKEILALRAEQAALHGFDSFAAYQADDTMAKTPARIAELLLDVWPRARAAAERENAALAAFAAEQALLPAGAAVETWDRRFVAEKLRAARFDFDDAEVKPCAFNAHSAAAPAAPATATPTSLTPNPTRAPRP